MYRRSFKLKIQFVYITLKIVTWCTILEHPEAILDTIAIFGFQTSCFVAASTLHRRHLKTDVALSLRRFGLPSTIIRQENGAFQKRSSNRRNLKTPATVCIFAWTEKKIENGFFRRLPDRVFLQHKSKMIGVCCVFEFLRRSADGKHLMRFQSETEFVLQIPPAHCGQGLRFHSSLLKPTKSKYFSTR